MTNLLTSGVASDLLACWSVMLLPASAICTYELVLLAGRQNAAGGWIRRQMSRRWAGPWVLPVLAIVAEVPACVLAPLVIGAELAVRAHRRRRGEPIAPVWWPQVTQSAKGTSGGRT